MDCGETDIYRMGGRRDKKLRLNASSGGPVLGQVVDRRPKSRKGGGHFTSNSGDNLNREGEFSQKIPK